MDDSPYRFIKRIEWPDLTEPEIKPLEELEETGILAQLKNREFYSD